MHKRIIFHCMTHCEGLEQYIHKKIEKVEKFFKREHLPVYIDIMLESNREKHLFKVGLQVNSTHYHNGVHTQGYDMYAMVDQAIRKLIKDIARKKEKMGHGYHLSYGV